MSDHAMNPSGNPNPELAMVTSMELIAELKARGQLGLAVLISPDGLIRIDHNGSIISAIGMSDFARTKLRKHIEDEYKSEEPAQ